VRTPVLALTANAMAHHVAEYEQAGFDGVAAKPIQFIQLIEAIDAAVAHAEQRQAAAA
jgi:CheY-like chemotaxis protein